MATVDVKDAAGSTVAIEKPLAPGRAAEAASKPVALSTEDLAVLSGISGKLPASLGIKTAANSLSVAPASDAAFSQGAPRVGTTTILAATTSATGSLWVAFGSQACTALDVVNTRSTSGATPAADAAVAIRARRTSTTEWVTIRAGGSYMLTGLTNANQVEIQREDQSNTQLPVTGVALA
jgi:hypothetical protein